VDWELSLLVLSTAVATQKYVTPLCTFWSLKLIAATGDEVNLVNGPLDVVPR